MPKQITINAKPESDDLRMTFYIVDNDGQKQVRVTTVVGTDLPGVGSEQVNDDRLADSGLTGPERTQLLALLKKVRDAALVKLGF